MAGSFISWESICKGVAAQTEVSQHDKSTIIHERHHSSKYLSRYQLASSLFLQTAHASRVILKEDYPVSVCNGRGLLAICSEVFFPLTELCCFLKSEAPDSDNASGCTEGGGGPHAKQKRGRLNQRRIRLIGFSLNANKLSKNR